MRKKRRDTVTYDLKRGQRVVYRGTTKNPRVREQMHRTEGKNFDRLVVTSGKMTEPGAKKKEAEKLKTYRKWHSGRNPQYNKTRRG
jgi:hypothetical protein